MRSKYARVAALVVAFAAAMTMRPQAQTPAPMGAAPFDITGFIDVATVTPEADGFSGAGTITVNGTTIIVPKHTLLQMPAFALTWQEVFEMAPEQWKAKGASGLAKADRDVQGDAPMTTYEVRIQGNRLKSGDTEQYIAGLMFIAQQSLNGGAGYINYIDYTTGELRVGGKLDDPKTGARVIINDPIGRFAPQRGDDPRFTIDEDNPTVRSDTGYPMCVPKNGFADGDDTCPQSNRPKQGGTFLSTFMMDATPDWEFMNPGAAKNGTDPRMMAPFEVGDYVTYSGHLSNDADGDFILAHAVTANVGIYTQPGTSPTYVAIDVALMGVGGAPDPMLPQEAATRTKIEGFTTDPSSFIMLSAIDLDPCTGQEWERFYDMVAVDPGAPVGAVAGRWRWVPQADGFVLPPTRMLRATSINGTYFDWTTGETKTPAGLAPGVYNSPNFEYIFPENLGIGNPPVPSNFQDFPFLANGSGAYYGAVPTADEYGMPKKLGRLGQLDPWPGATVPIAPACNVDDYGNELPAKFTPIADAASGAPEVRRGDVVTLDASGSRDTSSPFLMPLRYTWTQTDAAGTPLDDRDIAHRIQLPAGVTPFGMTTDAPKMTFAIEKFVNGQNVPDGTVLTFRVDVTNCSIWSDPATCGSAFALTTVAIARQPKPTDTITGVTATWRATRSRLDVNATTSDGSAVLTLAGFGEMGPSLSNVAGVPSSPGDRSYTQVGVNPMPTEITVRSSLGASVTVAVTIRP